MTTISIDTLSSRLAALGQVPPAELTEARLALHWAAQVVAAFGFSAVPPRDDFSHSAMHWSEPARALLSEAEPDTGLHAALHPVDFSLSLRRADETLETLALVGRSLDQAHAWLGEALDRAGHPLAEGVTEAGHLDQMPAHPVARGEPFASPPQAHREALARWFAAAHALVSVVTAEIPAMGPVRCWPHHFDTAALHVIDGAGESMRSVGVGLSPGDEGCPEPYVYVTPWPYPKGELPALPWGRWHTEGWTGAVLEARALLQEPGPTRANRLMRMIRVAHRESVAAMA